MIMAKINRGPISKSIKKLCGGLCLENVSEAEKDSSFKKGLRDVLEQYDNLFYIAEPLHKYANELCHDETRVWRLADEVEPRIKQAWENNKENWGNK